MKLKEGFAYFIKDEFFTKVNDPYLKTNKGSTQRPHFFMFTDKKGVLWVVPMSSKIDKFQKIIDTKRKYNKKTDGIVIDIIQGKKQAILFQDMFPISEKYIDNAYITNSVHYGITNNTQKKKLISQSIKVSKLLEHGIKLSPTSPNVRNIYDVINEEHTIEKSNIQETQEKPQFSIAGLRQRQQEIDNKNHPIKIKKKSR